jgi:imidazolonepropionase-like amidohydrolase
MKNTTRSRTPWVASTLAALILFSPLSEAGQKRFEGVRVLRGGRVLDVAAGELGPPGQLWIDGTRILALEPLDAEIPEGTEVLDVEGCTLLPGLFDLHVHSAVAGGSMTNFLMLDPGEQLQTQLFFGVTHVVDLHGDQGSIFALRERSRTAPDMARLYTSGAAFTAPDGHATQFGVEANTVTSVRDVEARFEVLLPRQPDVIKAILEHGGWNQMPELPTLSGELFSAIAERAHAAELPLFSHVFSLAEAHTAVDNGADALVHGVFLEDIDQALVAAMVARQVAYVPTLAVVLGSAAASGGSSPYDREVVRAALHPDLVVAVAESGGVSWSAGSVLDGQEARFFGNLKRLADAGVLIGTGTDAGNPLTPHGPALLHELQLYVRAGLTPAQTLRAATLDSARILGVEADFGELAPGKVADIVVIAGDPLTDMADVWKIRQVLKAGQPVDREALPRRNAKRLAAPTVLEVGPDVGATVDGFDDADGESDWGGRWAVITDNVAPGGKSTGELAFEEGVARLSGELREGFQWGAWSGIGIGWDPAGKLLVNASGHAGLELRVRGTERPYFLTVNRAAVKDYNVFVAALPVTEEWTELKIPFSSLRQIGFGQPVDWAAGDLTGLNVDARNSPGGAALYGPFELELDWIRLY